MSTCARSTQPPSPLMSRLIPRSEWIAVLNCYLDDRDNDRGPVIVVGGIVFPARYLDALERSLDNFLSPRGIEVLHAIDFNRTKGPFKSYSRAEKEQFAAQLFDIGGEHGTVGIISSVDKQYFRENIKPQAGMQHISPVGYAFGKVVTALRFKIIPDDRHYPISFLIESGNKSSGNIVKYVNHLKKTDGYSARLGAVSFLQKRDCRSIQFADFLAFHGRKLSETWHTERYPETFPMGGILSIAQGRIKLHFERTYSAEERAITSFPTFQSSKGGAVLPGLFHVPWKKGI